MASPLPNAAAMTLMTLKITEIEGTKNTKLFQLEGKLTNGDAKVLQQTLEPIGGTEKITLDLSGVTFIDDYGALVVKHFEQKGVDLIGVDFFIRSVIDAHNDSKK